MARQELQRTAHTFFDLHYHVVLSTVIRRIKSQSARRLRAQFRRHFDRYFWQPGLWSRSYCVVSCGGAPLTVIRQYIERQNRPP